MAARRAGQRCQGRGSHRPIVPPASPSAATRGHRPPDVDRQARAPLQRLASVRESVNRGESLETVIRRQRPPIHFLREQSFKAQVNRWSDERLADALDMLLEAEALSRTTAVPAEAVCGRTLMNIAALAKAR